MAKLSTQEKAIVLGGILEKFGMKVDIKKGPAGASGVGKGGDCYVVESHDFVFLLGIHDQQDGYMVHVMSDAALAILVMEQVNRGCPGLVSYGPYARDAEKAGQFIQGEAAMKIKDSLIMFRAYQIMEERKAAEAPAVAPEEEHGTIILTT